MTRLCKTAGLLALLFFCFAARASAMGGGEKKAPVRQTPKSESQAIPGGGSAGEAEPQNRLVRVSGRVRMVGTGIFPELVITGDDREWYIDKNEQTKLTDLQQRRVTVEGYESYSNLTFANGLPAGRRYTLKNIKLVNIE
ncbi:MAG: hypothetical protein LBJ86_03950 [Spirochaetaceae bacterium]|jgi:hypothetical protein|nr:hypothetical protein [Spirochaetaceae bacterium]